MIFWSNFFTVFLSILVSFRNIIGAIWTVLFFFLSKLAIFKFNSVSFILDS